MKFIFIIVVTVISTCSKTVTLDASKSYAAPGDSIVKYHWSGNDNIKNPDSMVTTATLKSGNTLTLTVTTKNGFINDTTGIVP